MKTRINQSETYELYKGKITKFARMEPSQDLFNFTGLDTESYEDGKLLCICTEKQDLVYDKLQPSFEKIADFLQASGYTVFFCWNLDYDATVILKTLGQSLKDFYENDFSSFAYKNYTITYVKSKVLRIIDQLTKVTLLIYDISQFYGKKKLDTVAKQYLRTGKKYEGKYQNKRFPHDMTDQERQEIVDYCKIDCTLTRRLANYWIMTFHDNFNFYPSNFASPATLGYQVLQTRIDPNLYHEIPLAVQKIAARCFFGGRFELFQRGKFDQVHHYDINSAYPFSMFMIPDLTKGEWKKINNDNWRSIFSDFGFCKIKVRVNETNICPFPFRIAKKGMVYFPKGTFTTFCTFMELKSAWNNYDLDVLDIEGYYFEGNERSQLGQLVKSMYETRKQQKEEIQKYVYKVMINAIYGKIAQTKPYPSAIYNPALSSLITGYTRSMLLDAMSQVKDDLIHVATDSIFSLKPVKVPISDQMGEWGYDVLKSMVQFSNGIYTFEDQKSKKFTKTRGFVLRVEDELGQDKFLNLNDCKINYDVSKELWHIESKVLKYKTLRQGIIQKNIEGIAKFNMEKKIIDLNSDRKRLWLDKLKNLNSQQRSYPLNVDWLK